MAKNSAQSACDAGLSVHILGCSDPFSRTGRSNCFRVRAGSATWLVDIGAPIFHLLSREEIAEITGVIVTHSHDDHMRWLSDFALYRFYVCRDAPRPLLLASETLLDEVRTALTHALGSSLSVDSRRIVDLPFDAYFDAQPIGPRARFRISDGPAVVDESGSPVPAAQAKVVVHPQTGSKRMLFRDPHAQHWVEPAHYYGDTSRTFYHDAPATYEDARNGLRIRAMRCHAWHGMEVIGVVFETQTERVIFSSDTNFNPDLFSELAETLLEPSRGGMSATQFAEAAVLEGDINDFVERMWSQARLKETEEVYRDGVVFHDVAPFRSIVHTDYEWIDRMDGPLVLVHTPDRFAARKAIGHHDKVLRIVGDNVYEEVEDRLLCFDADVYLCEEDRYFVGYRDDRGEHVLIGKEHRLVDVVERGSDHGYNELIPVQLYEDIRGHYVPALKDERERYYFRPDGKVEKIRLTETGSHGELVEPRPRKEVKPPSRVPRSPSRPPRMSARKEKRKNA